MESGIYILGLGNLGKYVAFALRCNQQTAVTSPRQVSPVTLLFHRKGLLEDWEREDRSIRYYTPECLKSQPPVEKSRASGFRVEFLNATAANHDVENHTPGIIDDKSPIRHLIVTTKTYATIAALTPIKDRLNKDSHILFLQNGIGVTDEVSHKLFPDPGNQPTYWAGICSAGVYSISPFSLVHAGHGPLMVGVVGTQSTTGLPPTGEAHMASQLSNSRLLQTNLLSPEQIVHAQLKKLVINAIINPLTACFDCKNGQVFESDERQALYRHLLQEAGTIIREMLPQSDNLRETAFSDRALGALVEEVAEKTANNTSSMLQDVQAGKRTEIDYINGYLVSQGRRLGLPTTHHQAVYNMIKTLEAGHPD
ncbi:ketopantoate reductase PanE/ApbA C terminal-domain-containing protein [Chaetomium tenue]|uniref:Ketopantoate reductase PanE/ApbA C terminal-domain-containing protein n=1 Tax=Chaetomium tenue TaxID=1854479 RepID=A0ACB7P9C7_9PEZI|nr:ketopantoate reductase PanE/ApbA C terminal-domain-containing protein [Chaetomium globosum]